MTDNAGGFDPREWFRNGFGLPAQRRQALQNGYFLVTGAGSGFGRCLAQALAAAGSRVILCGRRVEKLKETLAGLESLGVPGAQGAIAPVDLADRRQVAELGAWLEQNLPFLNGLIHSAGVPSRPGEPFPLLGGPEEDWDRTLGVNLTAPWLVTRRLFPLLAKSGGVRVLFLSSGAGWASTAGFGAYNVSKAALNSLAHSLAEEAVRHHPGLDVQINVLVPAEARTEMNPGSANSPYIIVPAALALLSHPPGGPNGRFFNVDGSSRAFGHTPAYERPLLGAAAPRESGPPSIDRVILDRCLAYDHGPRDRQLLGRLAQALRAAPGGPAVYGAGRLWDYLAETHPDLPSRIQGLIDDDPAKQGPRPSGPDVVPPAELPDSVRTVFVCSTKTLSLTAMIRALRAMPRPVGYFSPHLLAKEPPGVLPPGAVERQPPSIYPLDLPSIEFSPGQDVILLELPPRYLPIMPNGLACVHNILKNSGLRYQTVDLNLLLHHRHFTRVFCDGKRPAAWFENEAGKNDPWENYNVEEWNDPAAVDYFREDLDEIVDNLAAAAPKIVGISLNGNNRLIAREVIRGIREKRPETLILVGGYDCVHPKVARIHFDAFDYLVLGESEETLPGLIRELAAGNRPKDLPGVISKFDSPDHVPTLGPAPRDLDALGFPTYDWIDPTYYRTWNGSVLVPISTSRGCAWSRCNFCGEHKAFRKRSPQSVVDEIQWHLARGFDNFCSNESDVNGDPENLLAICREIIDRGLKVRLLGQLRIDRRSDPEFFETLRRAGFVRLTFGVDGWTDHVLYLQRKGYKMETVERNLVDCRRAGLMACVNMVMGVPGETDEDVEETIRHIVRLKPYISIFSTINMLRLGVNSRYYETPEKFGIRFRGDRETIYRDHPVQIPEDLWYSESPYIDHRVRLARYKHICAELLKAGLPLGDYAKSENARELGKIEKKKVGRFEQAVLAQG